MSDIEDLEPEELIEVNIKTVEDINRIRASAYRSFTETQWIAVRDVDDMDDHIAKLTLMRSHMKRFLAIQQEVARRIEVGASFFVQFDESAEAFQREGIALIQKDLAELDQEIANNQMRRDTQKELDKQAALEQSERDSDGGEVLTD